MIGKFYWREHAWQENSWKTKIIIDFFSVLYRKKFYARIGSQRFYRHMKM